MAFHSGTLWPAFVHREFSGERCSLGVALYLVEYYQGSSPSQREEGFRHTGARGKGEGARTWIMALIAGLGYLAISAAESAGRTGRPPPSPVRTGERRYGIRKGWERNQRPLREWISRGNQFSSTMDDSAFEKKLAVVFFS